MSAELYTNLEWLPASPRGFKRSCAALSIADGPKGDRLQQLAGHALDVNQLGLLWRTVSRLRDKSDDLAPLTPFRLGIVSNATSDFLATAIAATAIRYGLQLEIIKGGYDQALQNALDPVSEINKARCDAVLIAIDYRGLPLEQSAIGEQGSAELLVDSAISYIDSIRGSIRRNSGAICLLQTIARPVETLFGHADRSIPGTWLYLTDLFNRRLAESLSGGDALIDVAALAETVGLAHWHDTTQWNIAKMPFALSCLPLYADHVGRVLGAVRGKSRRVLVLDLDNTVWSGVIGDDGLQGIVIGQGDATGEAHLALQNAALALRCRGILLAVCSKNDEEVARLPFKEHPDMLLREDHIAVFQANWMDKASNMNAIAETLSLGVDSLAFVDDNPFERNFVRDSLPKVAVLELPADPALYARVLAASGCFESLAISAEDRQRAAFYQNNVRRATLQTKVGDLDEYLVSLEMEIFFKPFDPVGRSRISQLINKSNQFNLTTKRYTEAEVESVENDPDCFGLQVRLSDKFGDNGMISVIICRRQGLDWLIDTWLMSCRVLGRRVELAVLLELLEVAKTLGITRLVGRYIPTARNAMVRDHYEALGFTKIDTQPNGETTWEMPKQTQLDQNIPMRVCRDGL